MHVPEVELLWWEGCPSTERAVLELRDALRDEGLAGVEVQMREIRTDADAYEARFSGSPTILIDGADLVSIAESGVDPNEEIGLNCRVYRRRDGRISPTPDPDDLRVALRRAASRPEVNR
jgi:hypothetical protein